MSRKRSSSTGSDGGEFCIFERQPLAARAFEVDLPAPSVAAAFGIRHHALAELLVEHALTDAPHRTWRRWRLFRSTGGERVDVAARLGAAGCERPARAEPRRDPVQQLLRQLTQETRRHTVVRLSM